MSLQDPALAGPIGNGSPFSRSSAHAVAPAEPDTSLLGTSAEESSRDKFVGLRQEEKCHERRGVPSITQSDEAAVRQVLSFDGYQCPLPGHDGDAAELVDNRGTLCFACDCLGRSAVWDYRGEWRSRFERALSDAYWLVKTGQVAERGFRLKAGLRFVSRLLLTHEVGLIEPRPVKLPTLGTDADELSRCARDFFALLYGLRVALEPAKVEAEGIAFTDRLLAAWFGVHRNDARDVINALQGAEVVERVGRTGPRGPYLWRPGAVG